MTAGNVPETEDTLEVERLGYKQELPRKFSMFASFAIGFSFISVTTGVFGGFGIGLTTAGGLAPWAWLVVSAGQTLVALVFATLATRIPLAGSSYQWVSRMLGPTAGWLQGWVFMTYGALVLLLVNYTLAQTVLPALFNYTGTAASDIAATALIGLAQFLLLLFSTTLTGRINNYAVITEIVGTVGLSLAVLIAVIAKHHVHVSNLFMANPGHVGSFTAIGGLVHAGWWQTALLMGIFALNGFEGPADMSEETTDADRRVPRAIWTSIAVAGVVGFIFIAVLVMSTPSLAASAASPTPIANIIEVALGTVAGKIFLVCVAYSVLACGLIVFMDMTRIVYAMSRDKRVPGWQFLHRINDGLKTPIYATVCVGVLFLILLLVFGRSANALNTIGLTSSVLPPIMYGGPVLIALFRRNRLPKSSAWSLGRWEAPVNIAAAVFILLELFTLRDSSLKQGWIYLGVAIAVGVAYLIVRRITQGPLTAPGATAYSPDDAVAARHSSPSTQEPSFEPWEQE